MATYESLPLQFDATSLLGTGETIGSAASVLTDTTNGGSSNVPLSDVPTVSGNIVTQEIKGPTELTAGHTFRLNVNITITPNVKVWSMQLDITCPY